MNAGNEGNEGSDRRDAEQAAAETTSLAVLVPVYHEQYLVETSLGRLAILAESPLLERIHVIVVDDGSTDGTPEVLDRFRERVEADPIPKMEWTFLCHEENQGKGAAIRTALERVDEEVTVIHDADLEYSPADLLAMIPLFLEQGADAVFGSRFLSGSFRRVLFFRHSLGNRFLTLLCNFVSDLNLTDMETCYKMIRTEVFKTIPIRSSDFRMEPEITIKLAKRRAKIFEIPISYAGRTYQEGKKITWKDGFVAMFAILRFSVSDDIYTRDKYGSEILARLSRAPRFTRWMADVLRPHLGERVLEIGAGIGNLTVHLTPRTAYYTSDINPLYLRSLESLRGTRPYLSATLTDVTDRGTFPADTEIDTVICLNVIEHVEDDVEALKNIGRSLGKGGVAIVLVPRYTWLFGTLDVVLGHHRRYSKKSLTELGDAAGLRLKEMIAFNRGSVPAWWLSGRVMRRKTFGLMQIKMLNLLVPLFRALEYIKFLPSLSLIAVFENTGEPEERSDETEGDAGWTREANAVVSAEASSGE